MVTERDVTMTFTCFVLFDMFNALSCRSMVRQPGWCLYHVAHGPKLTSFLPSFTPDKVSIHNWTLLKQDVSAGSGRVSPGTVAGHLLNVHMSSC